MPASPFRMLQAIMDKTWRSWTRHPTATKLTVIEEVQAVAIDDKLHRSHMNGNNITSWRPNKWFGKKARPTRAAPIISQPKFEGWSGVSSGGVYEDESAALSNFLLVDRDRYQQIENDKRKSRTLIRNGADTSQAGALENGEMNTRKPPSKDRNGGHHALNTSWFSNSISEDGILLTPVDDFCMADESPVSPMVADHSWVETTASKYPAKVVDQALERQSWTHTPESKYFPPIPNKDSSADEFDQPLPSSPTLAMADISLYDGSSSIPYSTAGVSMKHATNASLYDGSSWGPISPRTIQSTVFPPELQVSIQERIANNTTSRLSLPVVLRYGSSQNSSKGTFLPPVQRPAVALPASSSVKTTPVDAEFRLSLASPKIDDPFSDEHALPSSTASPTIGGKSQPTAPLPAPALVNRKKHRVSVRPSTDSAHNVKSKQPKLAPRTGLTMTDAQLIGEPFAVPYRSQFKVHGSPVKSPSVRKRRGLEGSLAVKKPGRPFVDLGRGVRGPV